VHHVDMQPTTFEGASWRWQLELQLQLQPHAVCGSVEDIEPRRGADLKKSGIEKELRIVITFNRLSQAAFWKAFQERLAPCLPKVRTRLCSLFTNKNIPRATTITSLKMRVAILNRPQFYQGSEGTRCAGFGHSARLGTAFQGAATGMQQHLADPKHT
jgi:hypothetical protein